MLPTRQGSLLAAAAMVVALGAMTAGASQVSFYEGQWRDVVDRRSIFTISARDGHLVLEGSLDPFSGFRGTYRTELVEKGGALHPAGVPGSYLRQIGIGQVKAGDGFTSRDYERNE